MDRVGCVAGENDGGDAVLGDTDCTGGEVGHVTFDVGLRLLFAGGAAGLIGLGGFDVGFGFSFFFLALGAGGRLKGGEQHGGEIADGVGDAEIDLALADLVDGLFVEPGHGGGRLQRERGEVGGQQGRGFFPAAAHGAAVTVGLGSFFFLRGVVEKAVVFAALGRGLAVGSVLAGVVTARGFGVAIYFQELWDFHIHSSSIHRL